MWVAVASIRRLRTESERQVIVVRSLCVSVASHLTGEISASDAASKGRQQLLRGGMFIYASGVAYQRLPNYVCAAAVVA